MLVLQTNVATFGAKIQVLSVDMDQLKERLLKVQENANQNKENLTQLIVSIPRSRENNPSDYIIRIQITDEIRCDDQKSNVFVDWIEQRHEYDEYAEQHDSVLYI